MTTIYKITVHIRRVRPARPGENKNLKNNPGCNIYIWQKTKQNKTKHLYYKARLYTTTINTNTMIILILLIH